MTCWHVNDKLIAAGWIGGIKGMSPGSAILSPPQITSGLALLANFFAFSPQCGAWSQVKFIHNPRLHSHKFGDTRSLASHSITPDPRFSSQVNWKLHPAPPDSREFDPSFILTLPRRYNDGEYFLFSCWKPAFRKNTLPISKRTLNE